MAFYDAHIHLLNALDCLSAVSADSAGFSMPVEMAGCLGATCSHSLEEYEKEKILVEGINSKFSSSMNMNGDVSYKKCFSAVENGQVCNQRYIRLFGIHPQNPVLENLSFLEKLLWDKDISGIGEIGYDLYTDEYKSTFDLQEKVFVACLEMAVKHMVPVVIHDRKAFDPLVRHVPLLKKIPCCIFHGFAFTPKEAEILLSKGVNGYFSFGKAILNGNKKSLMCCQELPAERILLETDAPYMTLKGEDFTPAWDIKKVYGRFMMLRGIPEDHEDCEEMKETIARNYRNAFMIR